MRFSQKIRRSAVYILARGGYHLFNSLPRTLALFLGRWCGLAAWKVIARDRRSMFRHLSLCYNESLSPQQKVSIGRKFFINSGENIVDLCRFSTHFDRELAPLIRVEGLSHFDNAYKRGKGVFGVTAHLGNFELLAVFLARLGYRIGVISRPLADEKLNSFLVRNREKMGVVNFYASNSPLGVVRWLKSGGAVGVLIDTDSARVRGTFISTFGRLSKVPVGQSIIAQRMDSALVPMACIREDSRNYRVIIRPEIPITPTGDVKSEIVRITQSCNAALVELIDQYRDQWIWMHNRWRSSPGQFRA